MKKYVPVLTIAGFDGSGGAGIQGDIKTFSALGCYATSVLTALPIQNTQGVRSIYPIPVSVVVDQLHTVLDDIFPAAIKIGMVHTPELVQAIVETLQSYPRVPIVFDPVMVATSGDLLIELETVNFIKNELIPFADIITPNMDESGVLANMKVENFEEMAQAGLKIKELGCNSLLLKGGHQKSETITSLFVDENENTHYFKTDKIKTINTHGSGCTLSSAITAYLAQGVSLLDAVSFGQEYVYQAIKQSADVKIGKGEGPLNHFFNPMILIKKKK